MPHVKHKFSSAKADGTDSTLVKPSNWNAEHDLTVDTPSVLGAKVAGPAVELPLVTAGSGDDSTIWTKAAIEAAIAAAIATIPGAAIATGDIIYSMVAAKPGWLLLYGQTIGNVGSTAVFANASAEALFTMFWNITALVWPIQNPDGTAGVKGASANADWLALKKIPLPDGRGRVFAGADDMGGVAAGRLGGTPWAATIPAGGLGNSGGEQIHSLGLNEMPAHAHQILGQVFSQVQGGGPGIISSGSVGWNTQVAGGDNINQGSVTPHSNTQPTYITNAFIKL